MHLHTSFVSVLLGLGSLVMPTVAFSADDADQLYSMMMQQSYSDRVQTLRNLDKPEKSLVLASRINDYRDTHDLDDGQNDFLDKVTEQIKQEDNVSPELRDEAEQFFDLDEFRKLTSGVRDIDDTTPRSTKPRKRAPNCNCATGENQCSSSETCVPSHKQTCTYQINECGTWWFDLHCEGKCR